MYSIINKKYKSLVKNILSYSKLPLYFISIDFIIYLMKFSILLLKLNLSSKEIENMLLSLVPNNCEILFNILSNLDVIINSDIHFLFNNYNYLLKNNIELIQNKFSLNNDIIFEINKQLFKQAVKEDIRTLLFIPDHKLSDDIIEIAVQYNGLALKYIRPVLFFKKNKYSKQIITNIIELAVQNNGLALEFVDKEYLYLYLTNKIIELAVQQNGLAIEFVDKEYLSDETIEFAVKQNGLALQFINKDILTYKICILAIQSNGLALQYVPDCNLTEEICILAIQSNGLALQYVPRDIKTYEICKLAVQNNSCALEYVPYPNRTKEIINIALQKNTIYIDKYLGASHYLTLL